MSKFIALIAVALSLVAAPAGSALAGGGCDSSVSSQSVSLDTQTASTGDQQPPFTPAPESSDD